MAGGSLISASSLWVPDSVSALRPCRSTLAPSSLLSALARQSTSSAGLPRPSGYALVCHRPSAASGLHSSGCASSLRLCQAPPSLRLHLGPQSLHCSALALWILGVALAHRLSVSASGSTTTCSAAVGRTPGVVSPSSTMTSPSVGSTVGHHHGCGLGPAWLLLLQVPSISSLAPPSIWSTLAPPVFSLDPSSVITTLDSVGRSPPGHPTTSWTSSCLFVPTFRHPSAVSFLLHGRGVNRNTSWTFVFVFISSLVFSDLVSVSPWLCHYVQVCLVNYPHLHSPYKLYSVQCFFVRSCLRSCVCEPYLPGMDYLYVDY